MQRFDPAAVFDEDYRFFYADRLADGRSMAETELIWRTLELRAGVRVLDLACGHGRIANRLGQHGASVVGIDVSGSFLGAALDDARAVGLGSSYVRGDVRELPFGTGFDAAVCWYTSFGYFDDAGDRCVLDEVHRVLRPGGRLLLDVNRLDSARLYVPSVVVERGDKVMIEQLRVQPERGVLAVRRTVLDGDDIRRIAYEVRVYGREEIEQRLTAAGFGSIAVIDDAVDLGPGTGRMVVIATKEAPARE